MGGHLVGTVSFDAGHEVQSTSTPFTRGGRAEGTNYLPVSTVFDVLADERRRHLLYYLIDESGSEASTTEVAEHLRSVASEAGSTDREAILVELHHRHLPKMETAGLVEYEGQGGSIRYLEDSLVEECLARVAHRDFDRQP